ncbi:hypothetical protein [Rhizobium cauense]|uniref:hypothetical protein n=1 Tax=Rhizobium cauense TaxID=1166683 RepID=UPI001CB79316|nr:hypothetical protein [Rhizobium cauense]
MYEPFEAQIKGWLKNEPALSAASVLQRLIDIEPTRFETKNLRMVQLLVKTWRMEMAGLFIVDGGWFRSVPASPPPRRRVMQVRSPQSVTPAHEAI